jgi:YHS domain-containing protein
MIRSYVASAIAGAFVLGLASASVAAAKGQFDNMCAEGLALHKQIHTDCSVNAEYKDKTYCFGNEQAKKAFMKDPSANLAKAESYYQGHHKG